MNKEKEILQKRKTMRSIIRLFNYSVILLIAACTNHGSIIKGTLPSDRFHDEWIYWVPLVGASYETVDSARINNSSFTIAISSHNLNKMGIIRAKPKLRLALQEILVLAEAGTIQIKLDSISSAAGTALNEVLQNWKEKKGRYDQEIFNLRRKLRTADEDHKMEIQQNIETASAAYHDDVYRIIVENKSNEVGKFIFSLNKSKFTPEQILEIEH